ncbi:MAG TPA: HAMP domain-containing sensor histidine kinase [Pirellulales bacterium]|nr:HAMP domain-containing sensor histidine kinase [Pirellulales bacterium]
MRWPIRHQILLPFAGMMLVAVAGVSVLNAFLATRHAEERIDEQVRGVAGTLLDSNFPLTDAVLAVMRGLSGAEFVLTDDKGRVAASRPWTATFPPIVPVGSVRELRLGPPHEIDGTRYFVAALKMTGPRMSGRGPHSGPLVLHILYPEGHWRANRRAAAWPPLAVGAAALALSALVAAAVAGRLSRPIARLRRQVNRLAEGDFHTVPLPGRDDELRDLASGVNQLAEQLDEMRRVIRRTERLALLGQLAGGLAHHLRNDVTGARMAVQLHQRSCRADDQESLDVALRQLALTEEHLQRFLAAGQPQEPRRVTCEIESIVSQVVRLVEPSCRHRKVDLQVVAGPGTACTLEADPDQLRHVLMNLVLNAVDAVAGGGWVRLESSHDDSHGARVRVLDGGPGPPAEFVERLFEPFSTTKPEGVGLGLAVARQVAESHGGTLTYRRLDAATCFELTLPLSPAPQVVTRHPQAVIV